MPKFLYRTRIARLRARIGRPLRLIRAEVATEFSLSCYNGGYAKGLEDAEKQKDHEELIFGLFACGCDAELIRKPTYREWIDTFCPHGFHGAPHSGARLMEWWSADNPDRKTTYKSAGYGL